MICVYCQGACQKHAPPPNAKLVHFDCPTPDCGAKYTCLRGGGLVSIRWPVFYIRGEQYAIKVYDGVSGNAPEFIVFHYKYSSPNANPYQKIIRDWEEVVRWKFVPEEWTPRNQEEKLQKILPFL